MRRWLIWGVLALAAGAALWTAGWFWGRSAVLARADAAAEELAALGWTLSYGTREVDGFPLGYRVRFQDLGLVEAASGALVRVPSAMAARDDEALVVGVAGPLRLDMPVPAAWQVADPRLPRVVTVIAEGEGIVVRVPEAAPGSSQSLRADSLAVTLDLKDQAQSVRVAFEAMSASRAAAGQALALQAGALVLDAASQVPDGPAVTIRAEAEGVEVSASALRAPEVPLSDLIYGGAAGAATVLAKSAALTVEGAIVGDPLGMDGRFVVEAGATDAAGSVRDGLMDLDAEIAASRWAWTAANQPELAVAVETAALTMAGPLARSDTPKPGQLRLGLNGVVAEDSLWLRVDPNAALPRDPAALRVAVDVTARLMGRIDQLPPGVPPPFEISNIMVEEVAVDALGASARASGDIEIVQPVVVPTGTIEVSAEGIAGLADNLTAAGFLTPDMRQTFDAILQVYARPAGDGDSWVTEIETGIEGVRVNGQPLQ
ncbi:MAG: DUF2125 domain-containing protein [Pseudomonadota bacterium]